MSDDSDFNHNEEEKMDMYSDVNIKANSPLLSKKEEKEVTSRLRELSLLDDEQQDYSTKREIKKLRDRLILCNQRLIISIAKKYQNRGLDLTDLVQEGNIGLIKAINRFDPSKDFKFSTYAVWWIRHAISAAIANKSRLIRVPVHRVEDINKFVRAARHLVQVLGREPEIKEIANVMKISCEEVEKIMDTVTKPVSLETPVTEDSTIMDFIPDEFDVVTDYLSIKYLKEEVRKVLNTLAPKEEKVIRMRFGIGEDEMTLQEVSQDFHVTKERIRQIEAKALDKLRKHNRSKKIEEYRYRGKNYEDYVKEREERKDKN